MRSSLSRMSMTWKTVRTAMMLLSMFMLTACAVQVTFKGLRPLSPEYPESYRWHLGSPYDKLIVEVDTLQPTLRWEPFPRPQFLKPEGEKQPERIGSVTYELQILGAAAELVYERKGLSVPYHRVEIPLLPSTRYFWSVRARFTLEGEPKVTEWGKMMVVVHDTTYETPRSLLYSFRTPGAK